MKKYHSLSLLIPRWISRLLSFIAHLLTFSVASVLLFLLGFYVIPVFAEKVPAMTESISQLAKKTLPQLAVTDTTHSTDSDNDGLPDDLETRLGSELMLSDTDGDGVSDGIELGQNHQSPLDTDGDGRINLLDEDDDGDGIPSVIEGTEDTDSDGIANYLDTDSDNDGIPDHDEAGLTLQDHDNDRVDDMFDADMTGGQDANGDGIDDGVIPDIVEIGPDKNKPQDSDLDGIIDRLDDDDDNDGILTRLEDVDQDGSPLNDDTDNDGVPNYQDANDDGDSTLTRLEGATADSDNDGIPDYLDRDEVTSAKPSKVVVLYQEAPAPVNSKPRFKLAVSE